MLGFGDRIVFLCAIAALIFSAVKMLFKKTALYFKLIFGAVFCHMLGYVYDICEYYTQGSLSEGFTIGYLGCIGSFLFLLTANLGYMDGILDDKKSTSKRIRFLALLAPLAALLLLIPNFFAEVPMGTKAFYVITWIPAFFSTYFNLKHAIIPDMDFGFVKAIRPFNVVALLFSLLQLLHLTLWNFCVQAWVPLLISGILLGSSSIVMIVLAQKGVEKWTL